MSFSQPVSQNITFTGNVPVSCELGSPTNGTLSLGTDTNILESTTNGSISVTTNGGASLSIGDPILTVNSPANALLASESIARLIGDTTAEITNSDSSTALPESGTEQFQVRLELVSATGGFPPGDYTAEVTVTCEFDAAEILVF